MTDAADTPQPVTTTAYEQSVLADTYGPVPVHSETFEVSEQKYEAVRTDKQADELGGARVRVDHPTAKATLLVSNRDEPGWDIPGGARESGETPEETAVRECEEEVSLRIELRDLLRVHELSFRAGERSPITGLWVHFGGVPVTDPEIGPIANEELDAAEWKIAPPNSMDRFARPAIEAYFE